MARGIQRLTAHEVKAAKTPGFLRDGGGLCLQVSIGPDGKTVRRSWVFLYRAATGKRREMGLGGAEVVSLSDARKTAEQARRLLAADVDPLDDRKARRAAQAAERARSITFEEASEQYIAAHRASWKSAKHAAQWPATLKTYANPVIGKLPVGEIDVGLVLRVIEPIWTTKTETASRVRQRIETVLDWCAVRGFRSGENPARWRGHLQKALPARSEIAPVTHQPALPYKQVGAFMADLKKQEGIAALALRYTILTLVRTNESLGAMWPETDLGRSPLWIIPPERMKGRRNTAREHRVPLSRQAVAILRELKALGSKRYIFPGKPRRKHPGLQREAPLSDMAMLEVLRRMKRDDIVTHGFRSTFSDWAHEQTSFPNEIVEQALAHTIKNKVEAAYRRGDALEKRRRLMQAWADYCDRVPARSGKVVEIAATRKKQSA